MEQESEYKLIQLVDPTKVNVPLRNRFAKLTLSSNKKKNMNKEMLDEPNVLVKRQSTSRNLLQSFQLNSNDNDDIDKTQIDENLLEQQQQEGDHINPLLRSDSSSKENSYDRLLITDDEDDINEGEKDDSLYIDAECTDFMEPLQLSDNGSQAQTEANNDLEKLFRNISIKIDSVEVNKEALTTMKTIQKEEIPTTTSAIIIEDRKKLEYMSKTPVLTKKRYDDDDNKNDKEFDTHDDDNNIDDDTDDDDDELVITISDSSSNNSMIQSTNNYLFNTSSIATPTATISQNLDKAKADRMDAFLRDVSFQQREHAKDIMIQDTEIITESIDEHPNSNEIETKTIGNKNNLTKSQMLAIADTESMSSYSLGKENIIDQLAAERKQRLLALDCALKANQSLESILPSEQVSPTPSIKNSSLRLATDETEANTISTQISDKSILASNRSSSKNDNSLNETSKSLMTPNVSIVIPETSSESEAEDISSEDIPIASKPSEKLVADDSTFQAQLSQIQLSMASISISAKINIKIQIPDTVSETDSSSANDSNNDNDLSMHNATNKKNDSIQESLTDEETDKEVEKSPQMHSVSTSANDKDDITHAEELLTKLYGKTWQTPDIIRTLKSSNAHVRAKRTEKQSETPTSSRTNNDTPLKIKTSTTEAKQTNEELPEESVLSDFSIFRRNIVKTKNLDSTRITKNRTAKVGSRFPPLNVHSERKVKATPKQQQQKATPKTPQTEFKSRFKRPTIKQIERKHIESEDVYASDDSELDFTNTDNDASEHSWSNGSNNDDEERKKTQKSKLKTKGNRSKATDRISYLDLTKDEVLDLTEPFSPNTLKDKNIQENVQDILKSCRSETKKKLQPTEKPQPITKRKLFNPNFGLEDALEFLEPTTAKAAVMLENERVEQRDDVSLNGQLLSFSIFNKGLEPLNIERKPIEKETPNKATTNRKITKTPKLVKEKVKIYPEGVGVTPRNHYNFLKSLDVCVGKNLCHPDAIEYKENYKNKKEKLADLLYDLFNKEIFEKNLDVPLIWNKKLLNTAGRCKNKKRADKRSCVIELSDKVLTSADRLRCTLVHEMCHAAAWICNGEGGHGKAWKFWAHKSNTTFPELPIIRVCHQYDIEYKYTYKCMQCHLKSNAHSKSKKVENIRCAVCRGRIEVFLNKKDKTGNIVPTPIRPVSGFAKFVQENYKAYKRPDLKHGDVMKILGNAFSALKVDGKEN